MHSNEKEKINYLTDEVLKLSKSDILLHLRFLDSSIGKVDFIPCDIETIATNGRIIGYNPEYILKNYKSVSDGVSRTILHILLHCIFKHFFVDPLINKSFWNLACDITVENVIIELNIKTTELLKRHFQEEYISTLKDSVNILTAEKIYRHLLDLNLSLVEFEKLEDLFCRDDHSPWYFPPEDNSSSSLGEVDDKCESNEDKENIESDDNKENSDSTSYISENSYESRQNSLNGPDLDVEEIWSDIASQIKIDLETFSKQRGDGTGSFMYNLKAVTKEKYDYSSFLKRFSVLGEAMKVNDDEFDYIYYTYGLKMYNKMPLVEPLEYKEVRRIKEFVIAIDTSGSTSGELVQTFLNKTFNILKSTESFFTKINLHIIQCDADIQEDAKITSQEEFDEYIKTMKIKGLGGTDFRPVFEYVDKLIEVGELSKLKGLIYFTDGYGVFPQRIPSYNTVFVFIDNDYGDPDVPPWAIKLVLDNDEINYTN